MYKILVKNPENVKNILDRFEKNSIYLQDKVNKDLLSMQEKSRRNMLRAKIIV
jgi:hypothetical protein